MRKIRITIEVPEDYEDVHMDLILADLKISDYWTILEVDE